VGKKNSVLTGWSWAYAKAVARKRQTTGKAEREDGGEGKCPLPDYSFLSRCG